MTSCQATPLESNYKLLDRDCREYKLGMRQYEFIEAFCDNCGKKAINLGHYPDLKCGDSPWICDCGGNFILTQVETNTFSKYYLVECRECGTRKITTINAIGSNTGWICPKCGPDEHNGGRNFKIENSVYYNPKQLTEIEFLMDEGQTSLEGLFG